VSVFDDPADLLDRIDGVLSGRRSA